MYEKVSPAHPDKIADRIAGAVVDLAYDLSPNPKVACEVLIGHGECYIINETSQPIPASDVLKAVIRISGNDFITLHYKEVPQDPHLADNQANGFRCGDNGIFIGLPTNEEEYKLSNLTKGFYDSSGVDGKYIIDGDKLIICQSYLDPNQIPLLHDFFRKQGFSEVIINPLGEWTGGIEVDSGATNRKLGSDMGRAITGGGLHGKDLSKGDVSINIYAHLKAEKYKRPVEISCAIGDPYVDKRPYSEIVEIAREYIKEKGGFEKFAEYGLI